MPDPTRRQLRILRSLVGGNLIWEALQRNFFSQFDERSQREMKIPCAELAAMAEAGWIRLVRQLPSAQRLDFYEATPQGSGLVAAASPRKGPAGETSSATRFRRKGA